MYTYPSDWSYFSPFLLPSQASVLAACDVEALRQARSPGGRSAAMATGGLVEGEPQENHRKMVVLWDLMGVILWCQQFPSFFLLVGS